MRVIRAQYAGACLADRECLVGGGVRRGDEVEWHASVGVVHVNGCSDIWWSNEFARHERENEKGVYEVEAEAAGWDWVR